MSDRMESSIYRYILKHSLRAQVQLLLFTLASLPFVYVSLEIPKIIINNAIGGEDIPDDVLGFPVDQISFLFVMCCLFLGLVIFNGTIKYFLNVYRGVVGERMLRRLRYELYTRILRFPLPHFKRTSPGEIIPMVTSETEPLGGFIGDSFALPATQGGLLVTYLFFIYNQDVLLGVAATALYPFQLYVIPKLQKRVNELAKQRVLAVRKLADRIGESVSGVNEIHAHGTTRFERADIGSRLGRIYTIRYEIFRRKFFIKFLNNFLAQVTPFFFYLVGGIFVIRGDLTIGALVAVLAAYKDLASPWSELLKYYQMKEDIRVKYTQIIEQFHPPDMFDQALLDGDVREAKALSGPVLASNVSFSEDELVKAVDAANFRFNGDEHVAVVGMNGSGKDELSRLVSRLLQPTAGRISYGDDNLARLPESVTGTRMAYVGQGAFMFAGTVRNNLVYGLKQQPIHAHRDTGSDHAEEETWEHDARESGNSLDDPLADWIDYAAAGVGEAEELDIRALEMCALVEADDDIYQLGLRSTIDPGYDPTLAGRILEARRELRRRLEESDSSDLVEPFDPAQYNRNASVAENLMFGTVRGGALRTEELADHQYTQRVLKETGLLDDLVVIGTRVAETMVDLFADLPPGHELFEQFSFISAEDLPDFQTLLSRIKTQGLDTLSEAERSRLLSLAFMMIPARHRLGLIDESLQGRLLEARATFAAQLPAELESVIEFFDPAAYNAAATLQDNILFGKRVFGKAHGASRLNEMIQETVQALSLHPQIARVGLDYEVGTAGGRLSAVLRQKLAIARCLLKQPDLLILNDATSSLDSGAELRLVEQVLRSRAGRGVLWVLNRPALADRFDQVLVAEHGRVVEQGPFDELKQRSDSTLNTLLQSH